MKQETFDKVMATAEYNGTELKLFLLNCADFLPLWAIDVNDWQCNTRPSVYIHNKYNRFKMRRYTSNRKGNLQKAVKFYNKATASRPFVYAE